jgi:DNA-binding transcriptional LysR family regulator
MDVCLRFFIKIAVRGSMTPIQVLELFTHLVASGSMREAGRAMGVSPAVISRQLSALEDTLGTRIFFRPVARLELTASGRAFHKRVMAVLPDFQAAMRPSLAFTRGNDYDVKPYRRLH